MSELLQPERAPLRIKRNFVMAQEVVPDDAAKLESKQHARRPQVEYDERHVLVFDLIEVQAHAWQQERIAIPPGRAVYLQRNLALVLQLEMPRGLAAD